MKTTIENATKAAQTAELLLQHLRELNKAPDALISLLVLPEIAKVREIMDRMNAILAAIS